MPTALKHNITVAMDRELLKKARAVAAKRGSSISALLAEELRQLVADDHAYEQAKARAHDLMSQGLPLGGARMTDRSALHDRRRFR